MNDEEQNLPELSGDVVMSRGEMIYAMKMRGLSLSDIAQELHVEPSSVSNILKERFEYEASFMTDEDRQGILQMENARLDYYLSKLWPSIDYGDPKAIAQALKITELRVKVNQMDKITSTSTAQVLVVGGATEDYIEALKGMADDG